MKNTIFILIAMCASYAIQAEAVTFKRVSVSSELFLSLPGNEFNSDDNPGATYFSDKFVAISDGTEGKYTVSYTSSDNFIATSLVGGQISKFEISEDGKSAVINFTVPAKAAGTQTEIFFNHFVESLIEGQTAEYSRTFKGSWFDSKFGRVYGIPFFSDENFDGLYISFRQFASTGDDTLRFFLPNSALLKINKGHMLIAEKVRLGKSSANGVSYFFDSVNKVNSGVLATLKHTYNNLDELAQISVSALGETGLYIRKSAGHEKFPVTVVVKDCGDLAQIQVKKLVGQSKTPVNIKKLTLNSCEGTFNTRINETTTFLFNVGKNIYKKKVRFKL